MMMPTSVGMAVSVVVFTFVVAAVIFPMGARMTLAVNAVVLIFIAVFVFKDDMLRCKAHRRGVLRRGHQHQLSIGLQFWRCPFQTGAMLSASVEHERQIVAQFGVYMG